MGPSPSLRNTQIDGGLAIYSFSLFVGKSRVPHLRFLKSGDSTVVSHSGFSRRVQDFDLASKQHKGCPVLRVLVFEHLTVRQFINRMAERMGTQTSWVWQGGKDERMLTFLKGGFHTRGSR